MSKMIDMTGWKMSEHGIPESRLTVIKRVENTSEGRAQWLCQCECGNTLIVLGKLLRNGNTKSCGCLAREKASQRMRAKHQKESIETMIGRKFGKLTVIEDTGKRNDHQYIIYLCKCDCGNTCERIGLNLKKAENEYIPSCGCINSPGQAKIIEILNSNNINYIQEKTFDTCIFQDTNKKAKFDFYIPDKNYLIEYDGQQHYKYQDKGWSTKEKLIKTQKHDKIKNQWCKDNNIPLIRIPYTHFKNIILEDLLLETSNFILKEEN